MRSPSNFKKVRDMEIRASLTDPRGNDGNKNRREPMVKRINYKIYVLMV